MDSDQKEPSKKSFKEHATTFLLVSSTFIIIGILIYFEMK